MPRYNFNIYKIKLSFTHMKIQKQMFTSKECKFIEV